MLEGPTHKPKKFVRLQNNIVRLLAIQATSYILQRCSLGLVSKRITTHILLNTTHNVCGFKYQTDKYTLKHIQRKHKFTTDDFKSIPCVLHEPDAVKPSISTKQGLPAIFFEKTIGDFTYICIIEIRYGARVLAIKTCYKNRKTPC